MKASLERTLDGPDRDDYPGLLDIIGLDAATPDQLIIRLKNRSAFLLDDLVVSISKPSPGKAALGTGPYVTYSTTPTEVVMKAFPAYYRGLPNIEQVAWKSYTTARTAWAAMMRGEIDFLYEVAPDALDFMRDQGSVEQFSFLRNYVHGLVFNSRRLVFRDPRVRRALNYAVDRSAIIDQVFKGRGVAASTPTWPQHWAYDTTLPTYNYDPARASALLDAVGLKSQTSENGRPPARFRFTCIFPISPLWERMALIVQRNLSQVDVDVQFEAVPLDEFNKRVGAGNFDAILADFITGNSAGRPYVFWYSSSKRNVPGYHNSLVDQAFDRLRSARDDDATRAAFHDLQANMLDDPPAVFLAFGETTRAVSRRFRPVTPPGGDVFRTIPEWRLVDNPRGPETN